jgi:hypothetical protein
MLLSGEVQSHSNSNQQQREGSQSNQKQREGSKLASWLKTRPKPPVLLLGQPCGRYEIEKADFRDGHYGSIGDIAEGEERGRSEPGSLLIVPTRLPHPQACIQRG